MKPLRSTRTTSLATLFIPVALAAAGAVVYSRYRRELAVANARIFSGSKLANTPAGPVEYADAGTGIPVLAIHGAGGGFDQGLELARPLIDTGFRVIAPSRFGYLRTPLPKDASPMAQADAHAFLLDFLQIGKVAVVAASAGAPSAMQLCLRHPDRCTAMVLVVPLAYSDTTIGLPRDKSSAFKESLLNTALSSDLAFWIMAKLARTTMFKTILGTPPVDVQTAGAEEQARLAEVLAHIEPISRRKKGLQNESKIAKSLGRYELERICVPTLIIGVEDCLYNTFPGARYTAKNIQGARFVSYATGGHLLAGHQAEAWSEVIKFLNSVRRDSAA